MKDTIYRQAAIDALGERPIVWNEWTDEYELGQRNQYDSDKLAIETVPSAQPEIVRCKDCKFYTEGERWCRRLGLCGAFDPNGYCSHAERRTNEAY